MDGPQTHALAAQLSQSLCGRAVERLDLPPNRWQANVLLLNCTGQVLQRILGHGKWLFIDFSHGVTWACHLLAKSRWQISTETSTPQAKQKSSSREPLLTVHLRGNLTARLTGRPLFLILATDTLLQHSELSTLGPDPLIDPNFADLFAPRLRQAAPRTLASALLDQDILAGLGNALKCELLFELSIAPPTRIATLLASQIDQVAATIPPLTRRALDAALQSVPFSYNVYDRAGEPCPRCHAAISVDRSGSDSHWTWHCPNCQRPAEHPNLFHPPASE